MAKLNVFASTQNFSPADFEGIWDFIYHYSGSTKAYLGVVTFDATGSLISGKLFTEGYTIVSGNVMFTNTNTGEVSGTLTLGIGVVDTLKGVMDKKKNYVDGNWRNNLGKRGTFCARKRLPIDPRIGEAISWASKKLGDRDYPSKCLGFLQGKPGHYDGAYYHEGNYCNLTRYDYAKQAADALGITTNGIPPCGAYVFYDWWGTVDGEYKNWGHVGLSLGNGQIIHALTSGGVCEIRKDDYRSVEELLGTTGKYIGWAKPPLNPPISFDAPIQLNNRNTEATITASDGSSLSISLFTPSASPGENLIGIELTLVGLMPGATVDFVMDFTVLPSDAVFYKYNPNTNEYNDISSLITRPGGGSLIIYSITDGGPYDYDGIANGSIYDPLVINSPSLPPSGGGGGCFIATAAFGSPLAKQVEILRVFRNQYLLTNYLGRKFVSFYYRHSPKLANFISINPLAKYFTKILLYPLIIFVFLVMITKGFFPYLILLGAGLFIIKIRKRNSRTNL